MKRAAFTLAVFTLLAGCVETTARGGDGAVVDSAANFDAAVASIGCDLKFESDYLPVELQTGMSREEIQQVAAIKVRRGQAVALSGGGIRSIVGICDPAANAPKQS
ncbi:hypothetical protein [Planktotalea arctica]|uniref:hypothetical protein n=1 Tax=Planktotalea arctica TaxID=1481893 RepID=UPI000A16D3E2|nr:hypothetical protein [Planktotalea arctica]